MTMGHHNTDGGIKTTLQFIKTGLKPLLSALHALCNVQTRTWLRAV